MMDRRKLYLSSLALTTLAAFIAPAYLYALSCAIVSNASSPITLGIPYNLTVGVDTNDPDYIAKDLMHNKPSRHFKHFGVNCGDKNVSDFFRDASSVIVDAKFWGILPVKKRAYCA